MRRRIQLGVTVVAVMAAMLVSSQAVELGVFGSWVDGNDLDGGAGAGVLLEVGVFEDTLALDVRGSYVAFDGVDMIPLEAVLKLRLPLSRLGITAGLGAGYYMFEPDVGSSDENVGAFPLLGFDLLLGDRATLFAEARWLFLESDLDTAESALGSAGDADSVDVDGAGVNIGLSFGF
jgi:hypothetical protein